MTPETLAGFLAAREHGYYDTAAGGDAYARDVAAIAAISALPHDVIGVLISDGEALVVPADERAELMCAYRAPASAAGVRETARWLAAWLSGERTARAVAAEPLLAAELARHPDAELQQLHAFAKRGDVRARAFAKKLGLL